MTQKERVLNFLRNGGNLTNKVAATRFNVAHLGAVIRDLRNDGYAIYLNSRANGNSFYRLGTPSRAMVSTAYAVAGAQAFNG